MADRYRRLRRYDRLRSSRDFRRVSRCGDRRASRSFVVLLTERQAGGTVSNPRLGVTVSRRVGGSVTRNRVKRHIREWFRRRRELLPTADLVVIARSSAACLGGREASEELSGLFASSSEGSLEP